jgi:hypothetical protein
MSQKRAGSQDVGLIQCSEISEKAVGFVPWVSSSMNGADISRAITSGFHPHLDPAGFAKAVHGFEKARLRENSERLIKGLTKCRGYVRSRIWREAGEMRRDTKVSMPTWTGRGVEVEEWSRSGSEPIFVFRPSAHSETLSAFRLHGTGKWTRIV